MSRDFWLASIEDFARSKFPKKGKCEKSCFANGWHRVGVVCTRSILDGGLSGDSASEICLECGKIFRNKWFIPKKQPNILTPVKTGRRVG